MRCDEFRDNLSELADREGSPAEVQCVVEHLRSCTSCAEEYRSLVSLKRLVHAKTRHPSAPVGLSSSLRRQLAAERRGAVSLYRPSAVAAAVLLLSGLIGGAVWLGTLRNGGKRVAHANVLQRCVEDYHQRIAAEAARPPQVLGDEQRTPLREDEIDELLESIRVSCGISLDALTSFPRACYRGFSAFAVHGMRGLRLDFQCRSANKPGSGRISVFIFSLDDLDCPGGLLKRAADGRLCGCTKFADETVYCVRSSRFLFHVVTNIPEQRFLAVHVPLLIQVLQPDGQTR